MIEKVNGSNNGSDIRQLIIYPVLINSLAWSTFGELDFESMFGVIILHLYMVVYIDRHYTDKS